MVNPYEAPEATSDAISNVDYSSLPLMVPCRGRSRRERIYLYPIALGAWAMLESLISLFYPVVLLLLFCVFFVVLAVTSIGIWQLNRIAQVVAMIQLVLFLVFAVFILIANMFLGSFTHNHAPNTIAILCFTFLFHFLPSTVLLVLAVTTWKRH